MKLLLKTIIVYLLHQGSGISSKSFHHQHDFKEYFNSHSFLINFYYHYYY